MKVSIVVPIYNVEKYLERCLTSIIEQTYADFEVILVDDGSTDNSGKIADEYAQKDNRICVFHKENEGLAATRNYGIENACGEYICFIDSDDWIEPTYIEELLMLLVNYEADIVICDLLRNDGGNKIIQPEAEEIICESGFDSIGNLYNKNYMQYVVAWNKLYRKDIFDSVRYTAGIIHEDEAIIGEVLSSAKKVIRTNRVLYNYRINNDASIMKAKYSLKRLDILKALEIRMNYFKDKGYQEYYERDCYKYMYKILLNLLEIKKLEGDNCDIIKRLRNQYWSKYKESKGFSWTMKRRISMAVFGVFPRLYLLRYKTN